MVQMRRCSADIWDIQMKTERYSTNKNNELLTTCINLNFHLPFSFDEKKVVSLFQMTKTELLLGLVRFFDKFNLKKIQTEQDESEKCIKLGEVSGKDARLWCVEY